MVTLMRMMISRTDVNNEDDGVPCQFQITSFVSPSVALVTRDAESTASLRISTTELPIATLTVLF